MLLATVHSHTHCLEIKKEYLYSEAWFHIQPLVVLKEKENNVHFLP